jgi:hypothetical protein
MAYTINLDDGCISAEELRLMETKQSILKKLRARFGEYIARDGWEPAHSLLTKELPTKHTHHQGQ